MIKIKAPDMKSKEVLTIAIDILPKVFMRGLQLSGHMVVCS